MELMSNCSIITRLQEIRLIYGSQLLSSNEQIKFENSKNNIIYISNPQN